MQHSDELPCGASCVFTWVWPLPRRAATTRRLSRTCCVFFLDSFSLGACISVLPLVATALHSEALVGLAGLVALGFGIALAAGAAELVWRGLSLRLGRRLAGLVSGMCRALGLALMATAASLGSFCVGATLWALGAGSLVLSPGFVADIVPVEQRPAALGLLLVVVSLGLAAGANLGSLVPDQSPSLGLWLCAWLSLPGVAYALAFLPEPLVPRRRRRSVSSPARLLAKLGRAER